MTTWAKWVFGGLGWAMGGPIGGVLGFAMGAALGAQPSTSGNTAGGDFSVSLLILCAAVMKSDNRILKAELEFVKKFLVAQFGVNKAQESILLLRELLKQDLPLQDVCVQIRSHIDEASRLQLIHLLFGVSASDGEVHLQEVETIHNIANWLGVNRLDFESIKAMFFKSTDSAYKILEIEKTATNEEIKKAYKSMAVKHHPDKVHHLGPDFLHASQEKFKAINDAYLQIKKERGII